jgi:hypothetical protein
MIDQNDLLLKSVEQRHTYARQSYDSKERWWLALMVANGAAVGWSASNQFKPVVAQFEIGRPPDSGRSP